MNYVRLRYRVNSCIFFCFLLFLSSFLKHFLWLLHDGTGWCWLQVTRHEESTQGAGIEGEGLREKAWWFANCSCKASGTVGLFWTNFWKLCFYDFEGCLKSDCLQNSERFSGPWKASGDLDRCKSQWGLWPKECPWNGSIAGSPTERDESKSWCYLRVWLFLFFISVLKLSLPLQHYTANII